MKNILHQWEQLKKAWSQPVSEHRGLSIEMPSPQWMVPFLAKEMAADRPVLLFTESVGVKIKQQWQAEIESKNFRFLEDWNWQVYTGLQMQGQATECFYQLLNAAHHRSSNSSLSSLFCFHPGMWQRRFPAPAAFLSEQLHLKQGAPYPQEELIFMLQQLGYREGVLGELAVGQYAKRTDTLQIVAPGSGEWRLLFFDDELENILPMDSETGRPKFLPAGEQIKELRFFPLPGFFATKERLERLSDFLSQQQPALRMRQRFEAKVAQIQLATQDPTYFYQHFDLWTLLFTLDGTQAETLSSIPLPQVLQQLNLYPLFLSEQSRDHSVHRQREEQLYQELRQVDGPQLLLPALNYFYATEDELAAFPAFFIQKLNASEYEQSLLGLLKEFALKDQDKKRSTFEWLQWWLKEQRERQSIQSVWVSLAQTQAASLKPVLEQKLKPLLGAQSNQACSLTFTHAPFGPSAFNEIEGSLLISAQDFFPKETKKSEQQVSASDQETGQDLFAQHMSNMQVGDYVVHQTYGIGKYLGMSKIQQLGSEMDFITLGFQGDDKVYLPIYKINLKQRYASNQSAVALASLRSQKFEQQKKLARASAKSLAFDLMKLQAQREIHQRPPLTPPGDLYRSFEHNFPYQETADQWRAIEDILGDLTGQQTMDRLVCGDVGFGKTEVALRAAFKVIEDGGQVIVLVPTTILCMQHTKNFVQRLLPFGINVRSLSRFQTPKESKEILTLFNEGKVEVLVATHKVLSSGVEAKKLGLVIVDEEHRFGVGDKEKLKLLRTSADFLTLTATPIPRTLQQSFLGIKKISLIQTPPLQRLSVKCQLIGLDDVTIKNAIEDELKRQGQVFFVHNRVEDIESIHYWLKTLVPRLRTVVAHGQMPVKELEKRITDFFDHQYDLLLATTIIESGIDIPRANTLIVNDAHHFGLAQLHQLRGRIGRSDLQGHCYFVVPPVHELGEVQTKRLEAIMKYTDLGSGFHLANSDLEIRGAGELLGANQSGHINSIGLELYMELLQEAISELKGETAQFHQSVDIQLGFECFLPDHYIENPSMRLKYYKALANAFDLKSLEGLKREMIEIYGPMPLAATHLLTTLEMRNLLGPRGVQQITLNKQRLSLKFDPQFMERFPQKAQLVVQYFLKRPKKYRFTDAYAVGMEFERKPSAEEVLQWATLLERELGAP